MRSPEEVAQEWMTRLPEGEPQLSYYGSMEEMNAALEAQKEAATASLAALIRQRDSGHEARLREERERAWKAAVAASSRFEGACRWANGFGDEAKGLLLLEAHRGYVADYLAAVEGRKEGEGDA